MKYAILLLGLFQLVPGSLCAQIPAAVWPETLPYDSANVRVYLNARGEYTGHQVLFVSNSLLIPRIDSLAEAYIICLQTPAYPSRF